MSPFELDLTPEERRNQIIRNCGAKPIGERPPADSRNGILSWFIDSITKSTCAMPISEITEIKVLTKLEEKWREFGLTLVPGLLENNKDFISPIETAIKFITRGRNLPVEVINAAAQAAVREILLFDAFPDDSILERKHFPISNRTDERPAFLRKIMD
jgi:hypothetical protein